MNLKQLFIEKQVKLHLLWLYFKTLVDFLSFAAKVIKIKGLKSSRRQTKYSN